MAVFKTIIGTIFIMITIILIADGFSIWSNFKVAKANKVKYEKRLSVEMFLLLIWSFCLSCMIFL